MTITSTAGTAQGARVPGDRQPFFVVGAVRSGTTLLRLLLGHHPRICRCNEVEYIASAIAGRDEWPDVRDYVRGLPQHYDFRTSGFVPDPSLTFPDLARDLFTQLRAVDGRDLAGATVHNNFDELTRIWPEARFIHLARDPRDVARSCVVMGWAGNAWAGAGIWLAAHAAWRRLCESVAEERRVEVKFEDLTARPEAELERVCRFLGVDFDPAMLGIDRDTTYRRPSADGARSWRNDASEREIRTIEGRLGKSLVDAGYAPSGLPPMRMTAARLLLLRLDHRLRRMRASQRRYGLGLWTAAALFRPLVRFRALSEARRRNRAAMAAIDELHMR